MKIDPATVAFDVDSVIADTMGLFLDIAREHFGINSIRYEDFTSYELTTCLDLDPQIVSAIIDRIQTGQYAATLKPIADAPDVLSKVGRNHRPLRFVTARPYPGPINDWLHETLAMGPSDTEIIATGSYDGKVAVLLERDVEFFVEDRLETCYSLQAAGITPILFKQPWNRKPHSFIEVETWHELECLMDIGYAP